MMDTIQKKCTNAYYTTLTYQCDHIATVCGILIHYYLTECDLLKTDSLAGHFSHGHVSLPN